MLLRVVVVLALGMLLVVPTPAFAASDGLTAAPSLIAGGTAVHPTGQPVDSTAVVFECHAVAPEAVAVAITRCTYQGASAPGVSIPGPAVATVGTVVSAQTGYVCWTATAHFATGLMLTSNGCAPARDVP